MLKKLKISEIVTDAGTQVRELLNEQAVVEYAEAMAKGDTFPPVTVFYFKNRYIAADGFHRIAAAQRNGTSGIECEVFIGDKAEALKFALKSNVHHGLRRTHADKRHAVRMALGAFPEMSDRALAEMCMVDHTFVGDVRRGQVGLTPPVGRSQVQVPAPDIQRIRIGKDGKTYHLPPVPMQRKQVIGSVPEAEEPDQTDQTGRAGVVLPPPPSRVLDGTGKEIPLQLVPMWLRKEEVSKLLWDVSKVRSALRNAQDAKDVLFREVNYSSALSHLDQAYADLKTAVPFAVCPTCQGQVADKCTLCKGRGLISEFRWNTCVTRDDKEFRFKTKKAQ